jgi:hypothetical protein
MIGVTDRVRVIPSDELAAMRLSGLVGRRGRVAEQVSGAGSKPVGYMVCLDESFQGECLWFVPENAVQPDE